MADLVMTTMYERWGGRYSVLSSHDGEVLCWVMERRWRDNTPNVSCVPRGLYELVPHHGEKYQDTWALEGDYVSAAPSDKPRYACVFHQAVFPSDLQGCLAPCWSVGATGMALDSHGAMRALLNYLSKQPQPHRLMLI